MMKSYKIDGSFGEITNKLEDKIQSGNGVSLREASFAELTNFIPTDTALAESLNGIELECLIKSGDCKSFSVFLQGYETIIYIYQDKIISYIPALQKLFLDIIPEDILVNVDAVSSCIPDGQDKLFFNSTTGIYLATVIDKPENLAQGKPYFKITIPEGLKGEQINSFTSHVFYTSIITKNLGSTINISNLESQIDLEKSGLYILDNALTKVGDIVEFSAKVLEVSNNKIEIKTKFVKARVISKGVNVFSYIKDGVRVIYPADVLPPDLTSCPRIGLTLYIKGQISLALTPCIKINIPKTATQIKVTKLAIENFKYVSDYFSPGVVKDFSRYLRYVSVLEALTYITFLTASCLTTLSTEIKIVSTSQEDKPIFNPYTPYILQGRLAVSTQATVKLSAINTLTDFKVPEPEKITEATAFSRTIPGISEITFISQWGEGQKAGFVIGSPEGLFYFSSIANIFSTTLTPGDKIPCSYIPPVQIKINSIPAFLVVQSDRKTITAVIFTFDKTSYENVTDNIDFFDDDPIKKIVGFKYGKDNILFVLTDNGKLYGCLTGGATLAWFRIKLNYPLIDITTSEKLKKLFVVSNIKDSTHNLVGSIDFNVRTTKIKAEYFTNILPDDYVFNKENPAINNNTFAVLKKDLTDDFKEKLPKPLIPKFTLHNQEIINKNVNTKAERRMRSVKNVAINVRNSNFFSVKFMYKRGEATFEKEIYNVSRNNEMLDPKKISELVKTYQISPITESVQLKLEGNENSTIPLTIQSISFDTEYGNPR